MVGSPVAATNLCTLSLPLFGVARTSDSLWTARQACCPILSAVPAVALITALVFAVLPVRVESEACPSVADIEQALASMLPMSSDPVDQDLAKVERAAGRLQITLFDGESSVIAERALDGDGSCAELAALSAVVIASWESDVHPAYERPHANPPSPPAAPLPTTGAYDVALGALASEAGTLAVGGALGIYWFPRGTRLGLGLFAAGDTLRSLQLDVGKARWRRWMVGPEIMWRWGWGRSALDAHVGLALGWLATRGADFSENKSSLTFSSAGTLGLRWSFWVKPRLAAWVDLRGLAWMRDEAVYSLPTLQESKVPRLEGIASMGLAFGRAANSR
jgi:hypothetical protein